jgi:hypothetical protein
VATDFNGIWTNEHGYAPAVGRIPGGAELNDSGEIVYHSYDFVAGYRVYSTISGLLSDSDWALNPDINNLGEIVWQQSIRPDGLPPQWEIWSNLRGKIGNGEEPSINDAGEVVWKFWDGNDFEVYSSVRGQISSNDGADEWPRINDRGDIAWWQSEVSLSPEPSSIVLAVFAIAGLLIRRR